MLEGLLDPARWELTFAESGPLWEGFAFTLQVVIAGLLLSLVLGTILGVFSTTRSRILRAISRVYVEFYQNTPLPVQVFFMYMAGPQILQAITGAATPVRIPAFVLGFMGVGLYHAAYIAEVIRTGIEAVPRGQMEAALSQGFTRVQAYRYVILPQTFKIILPPLCNQALNLVKNSSVLALIAGGDLCTTRTTLSPRTATCRATSCAASCTSSSASRWQFLSSTWSAAPSSARAPR